MPMSLMTGVRIADFARTLSQQVREADDAERLKLHLSAVLVNNFTNYLYTLAAISAAAKRRIFPCCSQS